MTILPSCSKLLKMDSESPSGAFSFPVNKDSYFRVLKRHDEKETVCRWFRLLLLIDNWLIGKIELPRTWPE